MDSDRNMTTFERAARRAVSWLLPLAWTAAYAAVSLYEEPVAEAMRRESSWVVGAWGAIPRELYILLVVVSLAFAAGNESLAFDSSKRAYRIIAGLQLFVLVPLAAVFLFALVWVHSVVSRLLWFS